VEGEGCGRTCRDYPVGSDVRWLAKLAVQRAIAPLPASHRINHVFQRHVSRRLPISDEGLLMKAEWARKHLVAFDRHLPGGVEGRRAYEFGGGWDLAVPLCFWAAGVREQTIIDIAPHLRLDLVNHSLTRLSTLHAELEDTLQRPLRRISADELRTLEDLASRFGISYLAPRDARDTGLKPGSFDLVSSSDTLEHVPREQLVPILRECGRLLSASGVMSHLVDMMDHYRYVDSSLTVYNFLRFSTNQWRFLNSPIEPQNRLRLPDYRTLVGAARLVVLDEEVRPPTEADLARLAGMTLADEFMDYSIDDLGAKSVRFTAVPSERVATSP
jgi:hypothetical protein